MAQHIAEMVGNIRADLGLDAGCANVKAKTAEHLGFVGRGEGIAAEAVALLSMFVTKSAEAAKPVITAPKLFLRSGRIPKRAGAWPRAARDCTRFPGPHHAAGEPAT